MSACAYINWKWKPLVPHGPTAHFTNKLKRALISFIFRDSFPRMKETGRKRKMTKKKKINIKTKVNIPIYRECK